MFNTCCCKLLKVCYKISSIFLFITNNEVHSIPKYSFLRIKIIDSVNFTIIIFYVKNWIFTENSSTPSTRLTPVKFSYAHSVVRFSAGGLLITAVPSAANPTLAAPVKIQTMQVCINFYNLLNDSCWIVCFYVLIYMLWISISLSRCLWKMKSHLKSWKIIKDP